MDSGWWDGGTPVNAHLASDLDKLLGTHTDVKTEAYSKPIGTTLGITAYLGKKEIGKVCALWRAGSRGVLWPWVSARSECHSVGEPAS